MSAHEKTADKVKKTLPIYSAQQFYRLDQAAEFCGYAPDTFRDVLREYAIPRFGPKRTKFHEPVLVDFMLNPDKYSRTRAKMKRKEKLKPMKKLDI